MAADLDALKLTFWTAVGYFNGHNFQESTFSQFGLDDKVAMKRLDDPTYYQGIGPVKDYFLQGNGERDKAIFAPAQPDFQVVNGSGFVSGTAVFIDKTDPPPGTLPRRIEYSFAYSAASGDWKAIHLWGQYI